MKILRTIAKVFDRTKQEYVQRVVEHPISDELATLLIEEININTGHRRISAHGHGDDLKPLPLSTPLRSQKLFYLNPILHIVDQKEDGAEEVIGGWTGF